MSAEILVAAVAIAFLAALCLSTTGFGFALVMTPLLTLAWEVKPAVATSVLLSLLNIVPLFVEVRTQIVPSRVLIMLTGFVVGLPFGLLLFERLDSEALKVFIAATVIVASGVLFASPTLRIKRNAVPLGLMAGAASGAIGSSTSMNGPPVVLYLLGLDREINTFRATILAYFLPAGVLTLTAFAIIGRITGDVLVTSAAALPAMALGSLAGRWARTRVPEELFRLLVLGVLFASSGAVLASAAGAIG